MNGDVVVDDAAAADVDDVGVVVDDDDGVLLVAMTQSPDDHDDWSDAVAVGDVSGDDCVLSAAMAYYVRCVANATNVGHQLDVHDDGEHGPARPPSELAVYG